MNEQLSCTSTNFRYSLDMFSSTFITIIDIMHLVLIIITAFWLIAVSALDPNSKKQMLGNSYWSHSPFTSKFINKSYTHIISHINFHNAIKSVILLGFFWCQRNWFQSILLPPYSKCRLVLIFNRKPHRNIFICTEWLWLMQYLAMLMWYFMVARVFRTFYCV